MEVHIHLKKAFPLGKLFSPLSYWYKPVRGLVSENCQNCVTGTNRHFNRNSGWCRFCQYQEIYYTIIVTICICVCVCIEREKARWETAGESQSLNHSDGISESRNKRQEKTLKVMCFIHSKKITSSASSWPPPTPAHAATPRGDRLTPPNNANNATHYVKLDKKRRESYKRNYYTISQRVIIKAIIIIMLSRVPVGDVNVS